jgi:hypothetical protein
MKKSTFIEMYLVKYGQMKQGNAENLVKQFSELYPEKTRDDDLKCILGVIGYIKHSQEYKWSPEATANYIKRDLEVAVDDKLAGKEYIPSTKSYWVECNDHLPKL